jgi:predicted nucleic acid-binding protein
MLRIGTDVDLNPATLSRLHTVARQHALSAYGRLVAGQHSVSAYDAAYLGLAERRGVGIATLDRRLAVVARRVRVNVLVT